MMAHFESKTLYSVYCKGNGIKATQKLNFQSLGKFSKVHEKFMKKVVHDQG